MTELPPPGDWTPRGDPILALLPAERPLQFDYLPFEEQQWRGRCFLIIYTQTGHEAFSWATALKREAGDEEAKAFVASIDDAEIAFRVELAAQGRWVHPDVPVMDQAPGSPPPS